VAAPPLAPLRQAAPLAAPAARRRQPHTLAGLEAAPLPRREAPARAATARAAAPGARAALAAPALRSSFGVVVACAARQQAVISLSRARLRGDAEHAALSRPLRSAALHGAERCAHFPGACPHCRAACNKRACRASQPCSACAHSHNRPPTGPQFAAPCTERCTCLVSAARHSAPGGRAVRRPARPRQGGRACE